MIFHVLILLSFLGIWISAWVLTEIEIVEMSEYKKLITCDFDYVCQSQTINWPLTEGHLSGAFWDILRKSIRTTYNDTYPCSAENKKITSTRNEHWQVNEIAWHHNELIMTMIDRVNCGQMKWLLLQLNRPRLWLQPTFLWTASSLSYYGMVRSLRRFSPNKIHVIRKHWNRSW